MDATPVAKAGAHLRPVSYGLHAGIDMSLPPGTPLLAARPGKIVSLRRHCNEPGCSSCGNTVMIDGDLFRTMYCHFDTVDDDLAVGDTVQAGDYLGDVGTTGADGDGTYAPHLHFAMMSKAGVEPQHYSWPYLNPFPFLDAWCKNLHCP